MRPKILGVCLLITGAIVIIGALPLRLSLAKPNHVYGVRFAESFTSEANWYRINRCGGAALMLWALSALLAGLIVMLPSRVPQRARLWLGLLYPLTIVVPILLAYLYALHLQ